MSQDLTSQVVFYIVNSKHGTAAEELQTWGLEIILSDPAEVTHFLIKDVIEQKGSSTF